MRGPRPMRGTVAAVLTGALLAAGLSLVVAPAEAGEGRRYVDPIFGVEETPDLVYGSNTPLPGGPGPTLRLDLFEPAGDTVDLRPMVLVAHGGGFCGGSRKGGRARNQAEHLAARGWVAVSIDYRYSSGVCDDLESILAAGEDARAAVRWIRANAESLRVDETRISAVGYSAGAFIALGLAWGGVAEERVAAASSHAGAHFGTPPGTVPPVQIVHGDADTRVPTAWGLDTCARIREVDRRCELVVHEGVGHGLPEAPLHADTASFLARCVASHAGFPDVPISGPTDLEAAVGWMAQHEITTGYPDGRFKPMNALNRHQLATFLWRLAGEPAPAAPSPFPDVPASAPYADAVAWFAETGITQGYPDGTFGPGRTVTRHQVATFLWRAVGEPAPSSAASFPDVGPHLPYAEAVAWLASTGITTGYDDGLFKPANPVNRLQASIFLWRLARSAVVWDGPMDLPAAACADVDLVR